MKNNPLYKDFVNPNICVKLVQAGLHVKTSFLWVYASNGKRQLYSNVMDIDGYYSQALANVAFVDDEQLNPYSAFTLGDMEALMHNFTVEKKCNRYRIMVEEIWNTEPITTDHLPDAFAEMVLKLIQTGKLNVRHAQELIDK